ncbi:hypothetical protein R1sor_020995 [Riccia sorocarpa]|uniref:P-type Ca(2+) transporter n=1 Tax=Riccia sorocarpa TaxID=122646 RepID=A0ABD3GK01_9MARC
MRSLVMSALVPVAVQLRRSGDSSVCRRLRTGLPGRGFVRLCQSRRLIIQNPASSGIRRVGLNRAKPSVEIAEASDFSVRAPGTNLPAAGSQHQKEGKENGGSGTDSHKGSAGLRVFPAWARSVDEVAEHYEVDIYSGLTSQQVEESRSLYGWNELDKPSQKPLWKLVLEQFEDPLVQILLAAAGVSFILALTEGGKVETSLQAFTEPLVIFAIIILNAVIGVWQENKAENSLQALKNLQSDYARVLRHGLEIPDLPARELVPGDIVKLRAGDRVAADMRVAELSSGTVRLQQAALTGESQPVMKGTDAVDDEEIEIQGKEGMVFAGTTVIYGSCTCIVTATGMLTEIGKIQSQILDASAETYDTPLKRKLDEFADTLTKVVGGICVLVWLINYKYFITFETVDGSIRGISFSFEQAIYYFKVAVALAVAAIPEGLPAVVTTCLALGTRRMAEENAIVRKLPSVETLGCTSVICSDKTGTLTTNQMSVVRLITVDSLDELKEYEVTGTTYDPSDGEVKGLSDSLDINLKSVAEIFSLCNDAGIQLKSGSYNAVGMPTEAALMVLVEKLDIPSREARKKIKAARLEKAEGEVISAYKSWGSNTLQSAVRLFTLEFDRSRKSMSVLVSQNTGEDGFQNKLLVKGAAEFLLERCSSVQLKDGTVVPLSPRCRELIMANVDAMARKGLRILGCAFTTELGVLDDYNGATHPSHEVLLDVENYYNIESQLTFTALAGLQDPPRSEVKDAIENCRNAGIRVIVITGDNKATAEAICREVGIFGVDEDLTERSLTGKEFIRLSQNERQSYLQRPDKGNFVISRAEPIHKQEIVRVLQNSGEVVAMTGDGVNDAPALKLADIGISMGITGTEVAKEASDMVLADDNFASIVLAVKEGRSIYDNMKAFIRYLISSNIGEVVSIFLTALLSFPQGLLPVQLLWVNLVTDGAPATALGFNEPDKDILERSPRSPDESLISNWTFFRFLIIGAYVGIATTGIFGLWYMNNTSFLGIDMSGDGHTAVTWGQLSHWAECPLWPEFSVNSFTAGSHEYVFTNACDYFSEGKVKASTLSMSALVVLEMFNALNALSENNSLLSVPPWANKWLLGAIGVSMGMHLTILYTPWLADVFGVVPLSLQEWLLVVAISLPIIPLDEALKFWGRMQRERRN